MMKQRKKGFFEEAAELWWDQQEDSIDIFSDLLFNELEPSDTSEEDDLYGEE